MFSVQSSIICCLIISKYDGQSKEIMLSFPFVSYNRTKHTSEFYNYIYVSKCHYIRT